MLEPRISWHTIQIFAGACRLKTWCASSGDYKIAMPEQRYHSLKLTILLLLQYKNPCLARASHASLC